MNVPIPLSFAAASHEWDEVVHRVNAWRGEAIQLFAQAEWSVSETLELLAEMPNINGAGRLRRLVGQRFEDLGEVLREEVAGHGKKAADALAYFRRHEPLRPILCHGIAKLAIDRNGHWLVILRMVAVSGRTVERVSQTFEQRQAEALIEELRRDARALSSALQSLRARIKPGHAPAAA